MRSIWTGPTRTIKVASSTICRTLHAPRSINYLISYSLFYRTCLASTSDRVTGLAVIRAF